MRARRPASPEEEGRPDDGDLAGHVQAEKRGDQGEEEEDDDAGRPVDEDDGRGSDERAAVFRAVPDADDVSAEAGRKEVVEERADQVGPDEKAEGDVVALGRGQDPPAVGADQEAEGVEGEGQGEPAPGDAPELTADLGEGDLLDQEEKDEEGGAHGELEQEGERLFLRHAPGKSFYHGEH